MVSWWHPDENSYAFKRVKHNTSFSGIEETFGRVEGGGGSAGVGVDSISCARSVFYPTHLVPTPCKGEEESIPFGHR